MDTICMKAGDRRPILRVKLSTKGDAGSNPLSGAVSVTFRLTNRKTGAVKFQSAATIESIESRIVSYTWGATDTTEKSHFYGNFLVDYGGGIVQSFPSCDGIPIHID